MPLALVAESGALSQLLDGFEPTSLPPHVQDAIVACDLRAHAFNRALRGRIWLDENAPRDWRLQMIRIHNGMVHSMVKFEWATNYPLSLAYRRVRSLRSADGRPNFAQTMEHCGFTGEQGIAKARDRGFFEMEHRSGDVVIARSIDCHYLNDAWVRLLSEFDWHEHIGPYPIPDH